MRVRSGTTVTVRATFHELWRTVIIAGGVHCRCGKISAGWHFRHNPPPVSHYCRWQRLYLVWKVVITIPGPPHISPTRHIFSSAFFTNSAPIGYISGLPSRSIDMGDQHREDAELQAPNRPITGTAPATPRLAGLELDAAFDQDYDGPQLQPTRSISHSEDPANARDSHVDSPWTPSLPI